MIQRNHPNDPEKGGEKFDILQSISASFDIHQSISASFATLLVPQSLDLTSRETEANHGI